MRVLSVVLLALVAASVATPGSEQQKYANKEFLIHQKCIFQLLNHVMQPSVYPEIKTIANEFKFETVMNESMNKKNIEEFVKYYRHGLLPRGEDFSIFDENQIKEALALFHVFYYARDFETFYKAACWARQHVNEGMFVYALSVAVLHREDCRGIILPAIYEIYPQYFVNSEVIQKAFWLKMQKGVIDAKLGIYYGIETVDDHTYNIYANYSGWYVDYNEEQKLSYFTEDIGLNLYYYYFLAEYPFWMGDEEYGLKKDRRGELYYYVHQQLLARYNLERLSNNMDVIPTFSWRWPITTGHYPSLQYSNGLDFPTRPNNYDLRTEDNYYDSELVEDYEQRISNILHLGYFYTEDGQQVFLKKAEDIDILGNLMQSNSDSPNTRFYRYLMIIARSLLGVSRDAIVRHHVFPSALEHFETSPRDPMFWQLCKRIIQKFISFKNILPPYTEKQLSYPGVEVENVEVDELVTFFDYFTYDITNGVYLSNKEMTKQKEDYVFYAKQLRLNHQPFTIKMTVASEIGTDSMVRIFLGPQFNFSGHNYDWDENRYNFFELDSFSYTLRAGQNIIERKSEDLNDLVEDRTPTRELYKKVEAALSGSDEFSLNMSEAHSGFPNSLVLPKGKKGGMPFMFYVILSPHRVPERAYGSNYGEAIWNGVGSDARYFDSMPFGFPFDRRIDETSWFTSNMYFKDVMIFHKTEFQIHSHR